VHDAVLNSGWDTVLFAVPFLFMLAAVVFHVDEILAAPRQAARSRRASSGIDENGQPVLIDPDGRPSRLNR
jgi:hypothetical protein